MLCTRGCPRGVMWVGEACAVGLGGPEDRTTCVRGPPAPSPQPPSSWAWTSPQRISKFVALFVYFGLGGCASRLPPIAPASNTAPPPHTSLQCLATAWGDLVHDIITETLAELQSDQLSTRDFYDLE